MKVSELEFRVGGGEFCDCRAVITGVTVVAVVVDIDCVTN